ncbi:hypothetical protein [Desulfoscipio gibsoniae]
MLKTMLMYSITWLISFSLYGFHEALQLEAIKAGLTNPEIREWVPPLRILISLITVVAGLILVAPLICKKVRFQGKDNLSWNWRLFAIFAIPSIVLLITPLLYLNDFLNWLTPTSQYSILTPLWYFITYSAGYYPVAGTLIGVGLGLSLTVPDKDYS